MYLNAGVITGLLLMAYIRIRGVSASGISSGNGRGRSINKKFKTLFEPNRELDEIEERSDIWS